MDGFKKRLSESVQLRLSLALSLTIVLVAVAASAFVFVSALDEAHELQDDTLRQVAMLYDRQHMTLHYPEGPALEGDDEESRVIIQHLADGSQALANGDETLPLPLPATLVDGLATVNVGGEAFRVLVHSTSRGERIAVAQEVGARDKDARESAWRSLLPFLILFPVLLLVVGDLVRKLFRPIASLAAEIDRRGEQLLHPIDEQHLPAEVRPFVVAINRLLTRVAQAMDGQRRFVADAAHELRSPMTALSLQAERLAAAQAAVPRPQARIGVHAVYRRVLEDLLPLAEQKHLDIGVEDSADVQLLINPMDLFTLIKNLVDNAIRYTPAGGTIDLCLAQTDTCVCLQVKDSGPGISVEEHDRVFDPFYRTLGSGETGSGLGLSIVRAIAERVGARVALGFTDETSRRGLCVSLWFPCARG